MRGLKWAWPLGMCGFLVFCGCSVPAAVRRAEIDCALIFDSLSGGFREVVSALPAATVEQAEAKARLLALIDRRIADYKRLHEEIRRYMETDALAKALMETEPTVKRYLDWLVERLDERRDGRGS